MGQLVDSSTGITAASYEYYPYGGELVAKGNMAPVNPFRFSTKYWDREQQAYYYGYRYLKSKMGRWMSRDPVGIAGGLNLYWSCRNAPVVALDALGKSVEPDNVTGPEDVCNRITELLELPQFHGMLNRAPGQAATVCNLMSRAKMLTDTERAVLEPAIRQAIQRFYELYVLSQGFSPGGRIETTPTNRFVYTCKCGWLDMGHFFISAAASYALGQNASLGFGYGMEVAQEVYRRSIGLFGLRDGWGDSAFTVEDLPSDLKGAQFGTCVRQQATLINGNVRALQRSGMLGQLMNVDDVRNAANRPFDHKQALQDLFKRCGAVDVHADLPGKGSIQKVLQDDVGNIINNGYPNNGWRNFRTCPRRTPSHCSLCNDDGTPKYTPHYGN